MGDERVYSASGTASADTGMSELTAFIVTGGADAAVVQLREVDGSGTIRARVAVGANATVPIGFGGRLSLTPVSGPPGTAGHNPGKWYAEVVSGTTPRWTAVGA